MCKAFIKRSYFAGIIDGEGNISITCYNYSKPRKYKRHRLLLAVTNTDKKLIVWIKRNFGGSYYSYWNKYPKSKEIHRWECCDKQAENIINDIFPYLIIKKNQAKLAIKFRETIGINGKCIDDKIIRKRENMKKEMNKLNKKGDENHL